MKRKQVILYVLLSFVVYFGLSLLFMNHRNPETTAENIKYSLLQAVIFTVTITLFRIIGEKLAKK